MTNELANTTEISNLTFAEQISQFLDSECEDCSTQAQYFFDSDPVSDLKYNPDKFCNLPFTFTLEDSYGGESKGEEYWSVYKFTNGTDEVYVNFDGSYYSYKGSEYDKWFFVAPKEKTITVFERKEP